MKITTCMHTLLDDCFSCNVGDREHGIKYVTEGEKDREGSERRGGHQQLYSDY